MSSGTRDSASRREGGVEGKGRVNGMWGAVTNTAQDELGETLSNFPVYLCFYYLIRVIT